MDVNGIVFGVITLIAYIHHVNHILLVVTINVLKKYYLLIYVLLRLFNS